MWVRVGARQCGSRVKRHVPTGGHAHTYKHTHTHNLSAVIVNDWWWRNYGATCSTLSINKPQPDGWARGTIILRSEQGSTTLSESSITASLWFIYVAYVKTNPQVEDHKFNRQRNLWPSLMTPVQPSRGFTPETKSSSQRTRWARSRGSRLSSQRRELISTHKGRNWLKDIKNTLSNDFCCEVVRCTNRSHLTRRQVGLWCCITIDLLTEGWCLVQSHDGGEKLNKREQNNGKQSVSIPVWHQQGALVEQNFPTGLLKAYSDISEHHIT